MKIHELTISEKQIIRHYIFLPLLHAALEKDKSMIALTNTKFKGLYLAIIGNAIHCATEDMQRTRDELMNRHIRMVRRTWLAYEAYTEGHVFDIRCTREAAVSWINRQIRHYIFAEAEKPFY